MVSDEDQTEVVRGLVKWFDPSKGFGFVVSDAGGADILLHVNVLRNFGQSSVADGSSVEIVVHETPRGRQAVEIVHIEPPDIGSEQSSPVLGPDFQLTEDTGPLQPARVKWFDKSKGFGFANAFGSAEDIFVHMEVLRRSGLADLQPGEAVCVRVAQGRRGLMAVSVTAWEFAVSEKS